MPLALLFFRNPRREEGATNLAEPRSRASICAQLCRVSASLLNTTSSLRNNSAEDRILGELDSLSSILAEVVSDDDQISKNGILPFIYLLFATSLEVLRIMSEGKNNVFIF